MKVGTDIIQIARISKLRKRFGKDFEQRILSPREIELVHSDETLAGFWAAKEAVAKAFGCGIGAQMGFHDIEIRKTDKGAPYFSLSDKAKANYPYRDTSLSISHDGGFAIAVVAVIF